MPGGSAHFMTSTAGGTQGSSSYGGGSSGGGSSGSIGQTIHDIQNQNQNFSAQQAAQNFQNQQAAQQAFEEQQQQNQAEGIETVAEQNLKKRAEKKEAEKRGILSIIGHGEVLDDYIGDTAWLAKYDTGQHKLRRQLDRLVAKYGEDFLKTVQAKSLMNYLSGVAVERGGGRGARDDTYGGGKWGVDEYGNPIDPESDAYKEAEAYRQQLLDQITQNSIFAKDMMTFDNKDYDNLGIGFLRSDAFNADLARKGLSPEQYFNFRQQLMAADPTPGNQAYKDAFPWSSGAGVTALSRFIPGIGAAQTFLGGLFPEQSEWGDWEANQQIFKDTSMPVYGQDNQMDRREPSWWNANAESQPVEDEDEDEATTDVVDLTPTPTPFPTYGTGIAGLDWASLAPQLRPQYPGHYSNQGIQPNFANWYDNLNQYYGIG